MGWDEGGGDAKGATCEKEEGEWAMSVFDLAHLGPPDHAGAPERQCRPARARLDAWTAHEAVSARVEDEERDKSKTVAASNAWLGTRHLRPPGKRPVGEFPWQVSLAALGKLIASRLAG